jgi:hypothetical protein
VWSGDVQHVHLLLRLRFVVLAAVSWDDHSVSPRDVHDNHDDAYVCAYACAHAEGDVLVRHVDAAYDVDADDVDVDHVNTHHHHHLHAHARDGADVIHVNSMQRQMVYIPHQQ